MPTDELLILLCYAVQWIVLLLLLLISSMKVKTLSINLGAQLLYSAYFWYAYNYVSDGGAAIVHFLFWLICIACHLVVDLTHLGIVFRKIYLAKAEAKSRTHL